MLIGLAVGVDYTLFYLRREREERAAGRGERAALEAAAATSGRSVLVSGATVMIAMAGMLFSGDKTFMSIGIATMIVVAVAMLGSLTVLPAVLSKLGDRVEKGRIPVLGRFRRPAGEGRMWARGLTRCSPARLSATLAAALLLVLAIPALSMHTAQSGMNTLPSSAPTVQTLDRVQAAFPGQVQPSRDRSQDQDELARVQDRGRSAAVGGDGDSPGLRRDQRRRQRCDHGRTDRDASARKRDDAISTHALLDAARAVAARRRSGGFLACDTRVTGATAGSDDWNPMMKSSLPIVFAFVLTFGFLLLLASFRSLVIAAKAVILNLMSVAAAYGIVVATFQYGWGKNVLEFPSNGSVAPWLPLFLFVILFGLSMDYHVFILSRIREAYDRGMSTEDAVAHGIKTTAGTVTSSALVMVGVFSIFATLPILDMKEMGIGLASAVLIDATIVRGILLPASMKLLGEWNWYLPNWLHWLPKLEHHTEPALEPMPAAT